MRGVPALADVDTSLALLQAVGADAQRCGADICTRPADALCGEIPDYLAGAMRSSVFYLAPLLCRKLIERHPHIFGGDESIKDWDSLKNKEKGRLTLTDELESVPKVLPALMRAAKLQKRAARYGVETPADAAAIAKAAGTVETARDKAAAEQAMGELLFAAAALARKAGLDPERALQKCNAAFTAENTQTQES